MNPDEARAALADPHLSQEHLAYIAQYFPELRGNVAAHPNVYPELAQWLAQVAAPQAPTDMPVQAMHAPQDVVGSAAPRSKRKLIIIGASTAAVLAALVVVGVVYGKNASGPSDQPTQPTAAARDDDAVDPEPQSTPDPAPTPESTPEPEPEAELPAAATATSMNLGEIADADYSSIVGTWTGPSGDQLTVQSTTISWEAYGDPFATIQDNQFVRSVNDGIDYSGVSELLSDRFDLHWTGSTPDGFAVGSALYFFPPGSAAVDPVGATIPSDETVGRILALAGSAVGRMYPDDFAPYIMTFAAARTQATGPATSSETKPKAKKAKCKAPVPGVYACAGGAIPKKAKPLTTAYTSQYGTSGATLVMPSRNIGCDIFDASDVWEAHVSCRVDSWEPTMNPNYYDEIGGQVTATLGSSGPAEFGQAGDVPDYSGANEAPAGQVLKYGKIAYHGVFVFASSEEGLTIWNSATGYGALLNRSGMQTFGN